MNHDQFAAAIVDQYSAFSNALIADYLVKRQTGDGISRAGRFRIDGLVAVARFVDRAFSTTAEYVSPFEVTMPINGRDHPLLNTLRNVAIKNVNDLIGMLISGDSDAMMFSRNAGSIGKLLKNRIEKPQLKIADRRGAKWAAERFVLANARKYAYDIYINDAIDKIGVDLIQVFYPDATHANNGLILSVSGKSATYPALALARSTIFHPYSTASVRAYV